MKKWLIGLCFVIIFVYLRSINLLGQPLYLDEGIYINWSKIISENSSLAYISLTDGKTPLYFWLIAYLNKYLGNNWLITARFISVLAGVVSVLSWMLIFQKLFNKKSAFIFGIIFLITPYTLLIERMAFADSLLTAIGSFALLFWVYGLHRIKIKKLWWEMIFWGLISGFFLGLAFMVKTTAIVFLYAQIAIGLFWIIYFLIKQKYLKLLGVSTGIICMYLCYKEWIGFIRMGGYKSWDMIGIKEKQLTYSFTEIINNIFIHPDLNFFTGLRGQLFTEYMFFYLGGFFILALIGTFWIILKKKFEWFWLIIYLSIILAGVFLSGKMTASRYFYITVPSFLALATLGTVWLLGFKSKIYRIFLIIIIMSAIYFSTLIINNPQKAFYASDDKGYLVTSDLTALGIPELKNYFKGKEDVLIAISGTWGVSDGAAIQLQNKDIATMQIGRLLSTSDPDQGKCSDNSVLVNSVCWGDNTQMIFDSERKHKYLYLTRKDDNIEIYSKFHNFTKIKEFTRIQGGYKVYLIKL